MLPLPLVMIYTMMRGLTLVLLFLGQVIFSEVPGFIELQHSEHLAFSHSQLEHVEHSHDENSSNEESCALHCICHHINMPVASTLTSDPLSNKFILSFYTIEIIYLDPFLDPWPRPPLTV